MKGTKIMSKKLQETAQTGSGGSPLPRGLYIRTKVQEQFDAKRIIAVHVATQYIKDFDAVLLDAGSTAEMIAEEMFAKRKFLSVLTNNRRAIC
jgi:DeoR/GlpR family transcriptional regulator of sugar metabolism